MTAEWLRPAPHALLRATYYPKHINVISAGVFSKDIDSFFATADTAGLAPFANDDEVIQTIGGGKTHVFGVELEYTQSLAFLPSTEYSHAPICAIGPPSPARM